jgi:hypothetical protein
MERVGNDDDDVGHDPITGVSQCPAFATGSGELENKVLVLGPSFARMQKLNGQALLIP